MLIQVTAQDIRHGIKRNDKECPIALAIARITGHQHIFVKPRCIIVGAKIFAMPKEGILFVRSFDNNDTVAPVTLHIPGLHERIGHRIKRYQQKLCLMWSQ